MKIQLLIVLFIALVANACHKKALPPTDTAPAPVFYFKGTVSNVSTTIDAGLDNYYMKSSYYLDSNNVYVFKSELKQKECSGNCGYGLTILVNDCKVSVNNAMKIDSALASNYQFNDGSLEPLYYNGTFTPKDISQTSACSWSFNDGGIWNSTNCTRTLKANTTYTATLHSSSSLFPSTSHSNVYSVGNPLQTNVSVVRTNPLNLFDYKFSTTNLTGTPPFTYSWDFGDDYIATTDIALHEYLVSNYYTAKLTVKDANNDSCMSYYQVPAFNGAFNQANFSANFTPVPNTKAFSAVTILLNDSKGNVYSSNQVNQATNSHFDIVSVENYVANDSNQPLKKIKVKFSCTVTNGPYSIDIKDAEAVIAVAYKN